MNAALGISLGFVAMLSWGIGDFLIQRSTKRLGDWETLFAITAFGAIVLTPFVWRSAPALWGAGDGSMGILAAAGLVLMLAALLHFEGFKRGKLSVLEPLISLEIISAVAFSFMFLGDRISWIQGLIVMTLVVGLMLVSFRERIKARTFFLEKGVILFSVGALLMGVADFLLAWGSRLADPLVANFIMNVVMAAATGAVILAQGNARKLMRDVSSSPRSVMAMVVTDNIAWVAYASAMTLVPVAIATGLSESSIIVAVLLGLFINKERLQRHQKIGIAVALAAVIVLAAVTG